MFILRKYFASCFFAPVKGILRKQLTVKIINTILYYFTVGSKATVLVDFLTYFLPVHHYKRIKVAVALIAPLPQIYELSTKAGPLLYPLLYRIY